MYRTFVATVALNITTVSFVNAAEPALLDDQFVLPRGFHIYRAAGPELTGGSYDLTFDGRGRLLVAEGRSIRRLADEDGDRIYDSYETIADGPAVAGRGPQGLLAYDDRLYAVAGDGVQLFSGCSGDGRLKHEQRLGQPFNTGGDHAAHTVLRGLDGYIYLVTGDGGGTGGRRHITEDSSPSLEERAASVFRFDPTGAKWECIGTGGRNPPSLGMNYLGEFFSFDSDMEFHVDVPFYRPVRLNHWSTGVDLGWQGVGAFPPWYIDTLPGIVDVGRGSPNWGIVYEHTQLPERYRDAFIVCDYRWKSATTGGYATSGRLVVFHLKRDGATWTTDVTELAKAKPGAKDANGKAVNFALVDVDVAPDGSLFMTDHNQGVWRLFYDEGDAPDVPPISPATGSQKTTLTSLLTLPQPGAEWSRVTQAAMRRQLGSDAARLLRNAALDESIPARQRLRAVRLLASDFATLPEEFIEELAASQVTELRAQAAWLAGLRGTEDGFALALQLLNDPMPFVRRRAAEALSRANSTSAIGKLVARLGDDDRFVRHAAMIALSHRQTGEFFPAAAEQSSSHALMRLLTAAHLRKERPAADESLGVVERLLKRPELGSDLDMLRVLNLYRKEIEMRPDLHAAVSSRLTELYAANISTERPRTVRWEWVRLLGAFKAQQAFAPLVQHLTTEEDEVTQFHIAMALAEIPRPSNGWDAEAQGRLCDWLISTQTGWFSEYGGKGLQFPQFWATVLNKLGGLHADRLATRLGDLQPDSQLARVVFSKVGDVPGADRMLIDLYRKSETVDSRRKILSLLSRSRTRTTAEFAVSEFEKTRDPELRKSLLLALAFNSRHVVRPDLFLVGLFEFDDAVIVGACANGLVANNQPISAIRMPSTAAIEKLQGRQAVCFRLLELMDRHPDSVGQIEQALSVLIGKHTSGADSSPRVIWSSTDQRDGDRAWFAKTFKTPDDVTSADLVITCDNEFTAFINGQRVASGTDWTKPQRVAINNALRAGEQNLIAIEGYNQGGPAGLVASVTWKTSEKSAGGIVTNSTWFVTGKPPAEWTKSGSSKGDWSFSTDVTGPTRNAIDAWSGFTGTKSESENLAVQEHWHKWYLSEFKEAFVARPLNSTQRSNQEIHELIANLQEISGNVANGRAIYLKAGCYACHGGIANRKTTIFGPALGGVTLRLKRAELADSIVYPSKQVVERFKASVLVTDSGKTLRGFITEKTDDFVSITDLKNQVTRLPRSDVDSISAQNISLMPERLLSRFTDDEIRDLIAFLASLN